MSWLDIFRRRRPSPSITVTRGEDVAVFVPSAHAGATQVALGRGGWNCRVFQEPDETLWPGLVRNLPIAFVVRPGIDASRVAKAIAKVPGLRGVPLIVCGAEADVSAGLPVPTDRMEDLLDALEALRDSWDASG